MSRRYRRKARARGKTNKGIPTSLIGVWVLVGIFIGVIVAVGGYTMLTQGPTRHRKHATLPPKRASGKTVKMAKKEPSDRFEFYTLLPGMEIQLPDSKTTPHHNRVPPQPSILTASPANTSSVSPSPTPSIASTAPKAPPLKSSTAAVATPSSTPMPMESARIKNPRYIIQAGVFPNLKRADELKAQLILQGFNTQIQKIKTQAGHIWFRVTLGPFTSESVALNQKKNLEEHKIRSTLILQR